MVYLQEFPNCSIRVHLCLCFGVRSIRVYYDLNNLLSGFSNYQEEVLQVQAKEREKSQHQHGCLFCPQQFGRYELFQHMLTAHSFSVGQPDNMGG